MIFTAHSNRRSIFAVLLCVFSVFMLGNSSRHAAAEINAIYDSGARQVNALTLRMATVATADELGTILHEVNALQESMIEQLEGLGEKYQNIDLEGIESSVDPSIEAFKQSLDAFQRALPYRIAGREFTDVLTDASEKIEKICDSISEASTEEEYQLAVDGVVEIQEMLYDRLEELNDKYQVADPRKLQQAAAAGIEKYQESMAAFEKALPYDPAGEVSAVYESGAVKVALLAKSVSMESTEEELSLLIGEFNAIRESMNAELEAIGEKYPYINSNILEQEVAPALQAFTRAVEDLQKALQAWNEQQG